MFNTRCYACSQENCLTRQPCDCSCHVRSAPAKSGTDYSKVPPVYVVTTMVVQEDGSRKSRRAWGWHPTLVDAKYAVSTNDGDIFENDYNFAVVEEVRPGSITLCETRWWFQVVRDANGDATGAVEVPEPEWAQYTINFGIG